MNVVCPPFTVVVGVAFGAVDVLWVRRIEVQDRPILRTPHRPYLREPLFVVVRHAVELPLPCGDDGVRVRYPLLG